LVKKGSTAELEALERSIRDTTAFILKLRRSDMVGHMNGKIGGKFPGLQLVVDGAPFSLPGVPDDLQPTKKTIYTINWPETIEAANRLPSKPTEDELRKWADEYGRSTEWPRSGREARHARAVDEWDDVARTLKKLCK
jgi:hypothetical protein